jgi:hypothetical protein
MFTVSDILLAGGLAAITGFLVGVGFCCIVGVMRG